ncbi:twin transmembrane helix small protein [Castellaniella sp. S9]|uniref:twin transmembrane helix small protein n=1 Tax=Castellaniella sp. S9 TaxID=2993652 RepID=UPI0022B538AB|nr:twin transmembrane helix small protein [Castellaniella sp. S9]
MKIVIVLLFLGVVGSLASALVYLMQDHSRSDRMAWALTWRIGLSVLLFLFVLVGHGLGWIDSTGLRAVSGS